jgi:hypothetical protein
LIFKLVHKIPKSDYYPRHVDLSVSVRMEQHSSQWADFMKFDIWGFFENLSRKIWVSLKSDKNNGYFTWRPMHICDNISLNSAQSDKYFKVVQKIKTHFVRKRFTKNLTIYEAMWKIMVDPDRSRMKIQYGACAFFMLNKQDYRNTLRTCNT